MASPDPPPAATPAGASRGGRLARWIGDARSSRLVGVLTGMGAALAAGAAAVNHWKTIEGFLAPYLKAPEDDAGVRSIRYTREQLARITGGTQNPDALPTGYTSFFRLALGGDSAADRALRVAALSPLSDGLRDAAAAEKHAWSPSLWAYCPGAQAGRQGDGCAAPSELVLRLEWTQKPSGGTKRFTVRLGDGEATLPIPLGSWASVSNGRWVSLGETSLSPQEVRIAYVEGARLVRTAVPGGTLVEILVRNRSQRSIALSALRMEALPPIRVSCAAPDPVAAPVIPIRFSSRAGSGAPDAALDVLSQVRGVPVVGQARFTGRCTTPGFRADVPISAELDRESATRLVFALDGLVQGDVASEGGGPDSAGVPASAIIPAAWQVFVTLQALGESNAQHAGTRAVQPEMAVVAPAP